MPEVTRTALVMYSAEQMYQLVNDVARYPEFLPGCVSTTIAEQSDTHMRAEMTLKRGPISQVFSTTNTMVPGRSIAMTLSDGPFETLEGEWRFIPMTDNACKIEFEMRFEFKSGLIGAAFNPIFSDLTLSQIDAFTKRARVIYGESH